MTSRGTCQDLCYQKVSGPIRNVSSNTRNEGTWRICQHNRNLAPEDGSRGANCGDVYVGYGYLSATRYSYNEPTTAMNSDSEKSWRSFASSFAIYCIWGYQNARHQEELWCARQSDSLTSKRVGIRAQDLLTSDGYLKLLNLERALAHNPCIKAQW